MVIFGYACENISGMALSSPIAASIDNNIFSIRFENFGRFTCQHIHLKKCFIWNVISNRKSYHSFFSVLILRKYYMKN